MDSPCVDICKIDRDSGLCIGCLRSIDEITRWASMSAAERDRIMGALEERRGRMER